MSIKIRIQFLAVDLTENTLGHKSIGFRFISFNS